MTRIDDAWRRAEYVAGGRTRRLVGISGRPFSIDQYPKEEPDPAGETSAGEAPPAPPAVVAPPRSSPSIDAIDDDPWRRMAERIQTTTAPGQRILLVTSAVTGEGATETAVALARALAESGASTLLVDGDLSAPALHLTCGVANGIGVQECLLGAPPPLPAIPLTAHLSVLTAGSLRRGIDLRALGSSRMMELLDQCAVLYEWVVAAVPPVAGLPEMTLFTHRPTGVVFVIGLHTPFAVAEQAMARIGRGRVVATVLSGVTPARA